MRWWAVPGEPIDEHRRHVITLSWRWTWIARHSRRYPSVTVNIRNSLPPCVGLGDEVVAPDVSATLRPEPHARSFVQSETASLRLCATLSPHAPDNGAAALNI
jgi:hypothetical protein